MKPPPTALNKEQLLEAITSAQADYIGHGDSRQIFDQLLISLLNLTGSEYGYIGEVLQTPEGNCYLKTHAISNISWNDTTRKFYEENAPTGLDFYNMESLFGHVITHEEVVIANDPATDSRAGGLPEGHPSLDAYLGLPFITDGKIVGSAGISNRSGGYDQEVVNFLQPFMATCSNIILAERARKERQHNAKLKNDFISIISHELRTPMTSIRGSLGLIDAIYKDKLDDKIIEMIQAANSGCNRMLRLLDDILDVQKLESGTIELLPGECDIGLIIQKITRELESKAEKNQVKLIIDIANTITLYADADRIEQILVNLISNAIKFTKQGTVKITARDIGDTIKINISDDGKGIATEDLPHVFEKFHQVGEINTRSTDGVGLGLFIVKSLVDQHNGNIDVESTEGEGTEFTIHFPKKWTRAS